MAQRILTVEEYLIDLEGPVRLGDRIDWYVDEAPDAFEALDGLVPRDELEPIWILAGVELDDEDLDWVVSGTVAAIAELRFTLRRIPGGHPNAWEVVPGSGRLVERSQLDPPHGERFDPGDRHGGYLVTLDSSSGPSARSESPHRP